MVITLSQIMGSQILWAKDKHRVQAMLQIAIAFSNVALTAILIKWNPLLGASLATSITYFVGNVVIQNFVYIKYIGISMLDFYKGVFKGILPSLILSAIAGLIMEIFALCGWFGFLINCGAMVFVYFAAMYYKGMNNYEDIDKIIGIQRNSP